jgi:hypothetical protein
MHIEKIIEDVGKYHYVGCGDKKCKIMSSSDSKSEAKTYFFTRSNLYGNKSDIADLIMKQEMGQLETGLMEANIL